MTDRREHTFQRLIGCFPTPWQERYEEEIIAVLMESAPAGSSRHTDDWREMASLVWACSVLHGQNVLKLIASPFNRRSAELAGAATLSIAAALYLTVAISLSTNGGH